MYRVLSIFAIICCLSLIQNGLMAGTPHGTPLARAKNVHSGNKIRTTFYNYGLVGRVLNAADDIGGEWPINSGHEYIGDVGILVGSEIITTDGTMKHSVVTIFSPRGSEMNGDKHWGWEPLPGYTNSDTNLVAMSHMGPPVDPENVTVPNTWPDFWPDKLEDTNDPGWAGKWNGYFGKDQKNAEQESYFIMDDANDAEFDFFPDSTDFSRKGLGLNAMVRGLQWNHIMAEDVIFWLYDIKNIGNTNHDKMVFGAVVGTITGGDGDTQDDWADFDKVDDIAYSYDNGTDLETGLGGIGSGGWSPVGLAGYAFLESPGNSVDGIDNDGDGSNGSGPIITEDMFNPISYAPGDTIVIIDYDHDYTRIVSVMPPDSLVIVKNTHNLVFYPNTPLEEIERNLIDDNLNGIIDENNGYSIEITPGFFEDVYLNVGLKYKDFVTGNGLDNLLIDESRSDGIDNDGDWNPETDDVGLDGAPGSGDTFYGEGDGVPTSGFVEEGGKLVDSGLPGEPNIDKTDIDESDQIGLSSFYYFKFGVGPQMNDDNRLWTVMNPGYFNKSVQNADADFLFGSGYFPLPAGETERFSLALLFGDNLPDLIRNKQTVQTIYNQNYNFAKAPDLPVLQAYAGDGFVTLYWDTRAEESFDRLSGYDFEGYKIYKATDTKFTDAGYVTDAFGSPKFNLPIKQFDLDDEYSGFFSQGIDGTQFYLGKNTGLVHTWTDTSVLNGHRYFYAVTAYDHGDESKSILPAESSKFVTVDRGGRIQTAINVVAVVPDAPAAGYTAPPPEETIYPVNDPHGTGSLTLRNLDPSQIPTGHVYRIYFKDTRQNGIDDDGDWIPYWDIPNGIWDSTETFKDYGLDGQPDSSESGFYYLPDGTQTFGGYDPILNPDPSHDNYSPTTNCHDHVDNDGDGEIDEMDGSECADLGTEGNGVIDFVDENGDGLYQSSESGEPFVDYGNGEHDPGEALRDDLGADGIEGTGDPGEDDGQPTPGEPHLDFNDIDEAVPVTTHYAIVDVTNPEQPDTIIPWTADLDGDRSIFNGMQVIVNNDWTIQKKRISFSPEYDQTYGIALAPFKFAGIQTTGRAYPRDMRLIFSDTLIGTSQPLTLTRTNGATITVPATQTNFLLIDPLEGTEIPYAYIDQTYSYTIEDSSYDSTTSSWIVTTTDTAFVDPGHFSYLDRVIVTENLADSTIVTWSFSVTGHDSSMAIHKPTVGDTLNIQLTKPFTSEDVFEFVSDPPYVNQERLKTDLRRVKVVPNPYIAGASWEGQNPYATGRGPRALHFNHLPPQCEIKIFNLAGELVDIIKHESIIDDGTAEWDMLTKDNLDIAYGVYLYHIAPLPDSPYDFKPILGKFAVIK